MSQKLISFVVLFSFIISLIGPDYLFALRPPASHNFKLEKRESKTIAALNDLFEKYGRDLEPRIVREKLPGIYQLILNRITAGKYKHILAGINAFAPEGINIVDSLQAIWRLYWEKRIFTKKDLAEEFGYGGREEKIEKIISPLLQKGLIKELEGKETYYLDINIFNERLYQKAKDLFFNEKVISIIVFLFKEENFTKFKREKGIPDMLMQDLYDKEIVIKTGPYLYLNKKYLNLISDLVLESKLLPSQEELLEKIKSDFKKSELTVLNISEQAGEFFNISGKELNPEQKKVLLGIKELIEERQQDEAAKSKIGFYFLTEVIANRVGKNTEFIMRFLRSLKPGYVDELIAERGSGLRGSLWRPTNKFKKEFGINIENIEGKVNMVACYIYAAKLRWMLNSEKKRRKSNNIFLVMPDRKSGNSGNIALKERHSPGGIENQRSRLTKKEKGEILKSARTIEEFIGEKDEIKKEEIRQRIIKVISLLEKAGKNTDDLDFIFYNVLKIIRIWQETRYGVFAFSSFMLTDVGKQFEKILSDIFLKDTAAAFVKKISLKDKIFYKIIYPIFGTILDVQPLHILHIKKLINNILEKNSNQAEIKILDIDCGYVSPILNTLGEGKIYYIGVDQESWVIYFNKMIARILRRKNVEYQRAEVSHLPYQEKSMDVIISVVAPLELNEVQRILKPGGILVLSVDNFIAHIANEMFLKKMGFEILDTGFSVSGAYQPHPYIIAQKLSEKKEGYLFGSENLIKKLAELKEQNITEMSLLRSEKTFINFVKNKEGKSVAEIHLGKDLISQFKDVLSDNYSKRAKIDLFVLIGGMQIAAALSLLFTNKIYIGFFLTVLFWVPIKVIQTVLMTKELGIKFAIMPQLKQNRFVKFLNQAI